MTQIPQKSIFLILNSTYDLDRAFQRNITTKKSKNWAKNGKTESPSFMIFPKSSEAITQDEELSFQKDLLRQHLDVTKKYLPIFLHYGHLNNSKYMSLSCDFSPENLQNSQITDKEAAKFISSQILRDKQVHSIKFLKEIGNHSNLMTFVKKILSMVDHPAWHSLMEITNIIWSKYDRAKGSLMEVENIINYSQQIFDNLSEQSMGILKFQDIQGKNTKDLQQFFKIYCITVLLVISQYFQNPFFEEDKIHEDLEESSYSELIEQVNRREYESIPHKNRDFNELYD